MNNISKQAGKQVLQNHPSIQKKLKISLVKLRKFQETSRVQPVNTLSPSKCKKKPLSITRSYSPAFSFSKVSRFDTDIYEKLKRK